MLGERSELKSQSIYIEVKVWISRQSSTRVHHWVMPLKIKQMAIEKLQIIIPSLCFDTNDTVQVHSCIFNWKAFLAAKLYPQFVRSQNIRQYHMIGINCSYIRIYTTEYSHAIVFHPTIHHFRTMYAAELYLLKFYRLFWQIIVLKSLHQYSNNIQTNNDWVLHRFYVDKLIFLIFLQNALCDHDN